MIDLKTLTVYRAMPLRVLASNIEPICPLCKQNLSSDINLPLVPSSEFKYPLVSRFARSRCNWLHAWAVAGAFPLVGDAGGSEING
jgi:hypothetical protein